MNAKQSKDPLNGITLETIVKQLVFTYGFEHLGSKINIRCFNESPSIKSSLTFLRKTPWAQKKFKNFILRP